MNPELLHDAFNEIDDRFIAAAIRSRSLSGRRRMITRSVTAAACLLAMVGGMSIWSLYGRQLTGTTENEVGRTDDGAIAQTHARPTTGASEEIPITAVYRHRADAASPDHARIVFDAQELGDTALPETVFTESDLVIFTVTEESAAIRHEITKITWDDAGGILLHVNRIIPEAFPESVPDGEEGAVWQIAAAVPKGILDDAEAVTIIWNEEN